MAVGTRLLDQGHWQVNRTSRARTLGTFITTLVAALVASCASGPYPLAIPMDCEMQMQRNKDPVKPYQSSLPSANCLDRIERQNSLNPKFGRTPRKDDGE